MVVTTLEQSEKLLELGIDVSTADMAICNFGYMVRLLPIFDMDVKQYDYTPVWSLEALLELIPFDRYHLQYADGLFYCECFYYNEKEDAHSHKTEGYNNSLDPAFEMVVWLKENKFI